VTEGEEIESQREGVREIERVSGRKREGVNDTLASISYTRAQAKQSFSPDDAATPAIAPGSKI